MSNAFELDVPAPIVWLSYRDAALYLSRSERTMRRLVAAGEIDYVRFGGEVRFRLEHLDGYVERCTVRAGVAS